jgi:hypothetical protein
MDWLGFAALTALLLLIVPVWAVGAVCIKVTDYIRLRRGPVDRPPEPRRLASIAPDRS